MPYFLALTEEEKTAPTGDSGAVFANDRGHLAPKHPSSKGPSLGKAITYLAAPDRAATAPNNGPHDPPRDGVAPITLHFGHRFSLVFFRVRKAFECLSMTRIRGLWRTRAECHHFKRGFSYEGSRGVSPLGRHDDRPIPKRGRSAPKWRQHEEPRRLHFSLRDALLGRTNSRRRVATAKARGSLCCQISGFLREIFVLRSHPETGPFRGLGRGLALCMLPVNGRLLLLRERLPVTPRPFWDHHTRRKPKYARFFLLLDNPTNPRPTAPPLARFHFLPKYPDRRVPTTSPRLP